MECPKCGADNDPFLQPSKPEGEPTEENPVLIDPVIVTGRQFCDECNQKLILAYCYGHSEFFWLPTDETFEVPALSDEIEDHT